MCVCVVCVLFVCACFTTRYIFSPATANRFAANFQFVEAVTKFTEAINMYPLDHRFVGVSMSVSGCVIIVILCIICLCRYYGNRSFCYEHLGEFEK